MSSAESSGLCRQPSCYRIFKGARGLSIHLAQSKYCNSWYKSLAQDHSLSHTQPIVESVANAVDGIQSSPVPWSSTLKNKGNTIPAPRARQGKSATVEDVDSDDGGLGDVDGYSEDEAPSMFE